MTHQEYKEQEAKLRIEFNERLKKIQTWNDFQNWLIDLEDTQMSFGIHGKRRGYVAFDFRQHSKNPTKVTYLYDDGISVGSCAIKRLYCYLEVK